MHTLFGTNVFLQFLLKSFKIFCCDLSKCQEKYAEVFEEKNVVGFDIVELCPNSRDKSSDFLAAKLYYKLLTYKFLSEDEDEDYVNNFEDMASFTNKFSKFSDDDDIQREYIKFH